MNLLRWLYWRSPRHTDGRRPSGISYNYSKAHLGVTNEKAICGASVEIPMRRLKSIPPDQCKRCVSIANRRGYHIPPEE